MTEAKKTEKKTRARSGKTRTASVVDAEFAAYRRDPKALADSVANLSPDSAIAFGRVLGSNAPASTRLVRDGLDEVQAGVAGRPEAQKTIPRVNKAAS